MTCRLCGSSLRIVLDLGSVPPANRYRRSSELLLPEPVYPLRLAECPQCFHVQLGDPQPAGLFTDRPYLYRSGASQSWREHCRDLARQLPQGRGRLAVDLGSNDGTMLYYLDSIGYTVLGIDPSAEANQSHTFPTETACWTPGLARELVRTRGRAAVITAQNVFAHVEDARSFLEACAIALAPDGVLVIECPSLERMVEGCDFTPIYHEHVHYWSAIAMLMLADECGLSLNRAQALAVHNGSWRFWVSHTGNAAILNDSIHIDAFAARVQAFRRDWTQQLAAWRDQGEIIAGYGASAKAMTLLTTTPVPEAISWIADDAPSKQGWYTPGHPIPIVAPEEIGTPDRVIVLAWNWGAEVKRKLRALGYKGTITVPFEGH